MAELTKEWLQKTIAELEEERDSVPGAVNEDALMALAAMKLALASLEANGTLANEGTITATQFKPVADLYEVTVPSGRSTTFTKDAAEASDCRVMGWSVQEYVKLERYQAAMLQGADGNAPAHFRSRPAQSSLSPAQGGNSPVIPDGWVMVPVEPTIAILDEFDSIIDYGAEDSKDAWSRLLAAAWIKSLPAAPQREVK